MVFGVERKWFFITDITITLDKKKEKILSFKMRRSLSICVRCNKSTYSSFVKEKTTKGGITFKVYRCESCGRWKYCKGYMDIYLVYRPGFFSY